MGGNLRLATLEDGEAILKIYSVYILGTAITFEEEVPSLEEFQGRIRARQGDLPWIVYEEEGQVLGYAYASHFHQRAAYGWDAELSVYVERGEAGRGIGGKLYGALIGIMEALGYYNLYGVVTIPNQASEGLHRRFGFARQGVLPCAGYKLGSWRHVAYLAKQLRPYDRPLPTKRLEQLPHGQLEALLAGEKFGKGKQ